jgi:flavin reductase (DIM6/NTAB) family NADH-FMN oxidoreductase RutF
MSLSLNPPLIIVSVDKAATCYACFEAGNGFCVNILSEDQEDVSRRFATKGIDKFADLKWHTGGNGVALIDGALGQVECKISACYEGGDHTIVVGEILNVAANGERPLLFLKCKYQKLPLV